MTKTTEAAAMASLEGLTLHVENLERSLEFYRKIPGAEVLMDGAGVFAMLRIGTARLGLLQVPGEGRFHLEIETDDLDAMHRQLQESGVQPQSPPTKRPWGETDFLVLDPDGNRIEFGTALGTAQEARGEQNQNPDNS